MPLQPQSLEDVKVIVRKHTPDGIEADSVTRNGEWASFQLARKKIQLKEKHILRDHVIVFVL